MSRASALVLLAPFIGFTVMWVRPGEARDLGVMGQTWAIEEPDLLATIGNRLATMQANGGVARMQQTLVARARERVMRPAPVAGLVRATAPRSWTYDPSIVVEHDIRDAKGNLIAARGRRVNPLDFVQMKSALVFIDGDDGAQLEWATKAFKPNNAKIIFTSGSPFLAMKQRQRRFYFDQRGQLTGKFGIAHLPAVVRQAGDALAIEEIVVPSGSPT